MSRSLVRARVQPVTDLQAGNGGGDGEGKGASGTQGLACAKKIHNWIFFKEILTKTPLKPILH